MEKILETIHQVEQEIEAMQRQLEPTRTRALDEVRQEVRNLTQAKRRELDSYKEELEKEATSSQHATYEAIYQDKQKEMVRLKELADINYDATKEKLKTEIMNHGYR